MDMLKSKYISISKYMSDLKKLGDMVRKERPHCVVGIKRSGLFPAVFISHALGIPMFINTEVKSIPVKYKRILFVDTTIDTGKTLRGAMSRLLDGDHKIFTAVLYRSQRAPEVDFCIATVNAICTFFYEKGYKDNG